MTVVNPSSFKATNEGMSFKTPETCYPFIGRIETAPNSKPQKLSLV